MQKINLLKSQKILLVLYDLSRGEKKKIKFEDIVVALFRKFPHDFHLKGYEEYPDADSIRRPLYALKAEGLLTAGNMIFCLTDKGLGTTEKIIHESVGKEIVEKEILDRYMEKELKRIEDTNSFKLFFNNQLTNIFDTDFFDYLGISVRSSRIEFKGRLDYIQEIIDLIKKQNSQKYKKISDFHDFMVSKFNKEVNYKLNN